MEEMDQMFESEHMEEMNQMGQSDQVGEIDQMDNMSHIDLSPYNAPKSLKYRIGNALKAVMLTLTIVNST